MLRPAFRTLTRPARRPASFTAPILGSRLYGSKRHSFDNTPGGRSFKKRGDDLFASKEGGDIGASMSATPTTERLRTFMSFVPGTFVTKPLSDIPKDPRTFVRYQWQSIKARVVDYAGIIGLRWKSKPSIFGKARLRINRGAALAAGKALHARLGQAFAEGDRGSLRQVALPALYDTLSNTLARRNNSERIKWEVTQLHSARLASHRAMHMPSPFPPSLVVEQAVVAMDTTQKLERGESRSGQFVSESVRIGRRTEYLAVIRFLNAITFEAEPWSAIGNVEPTSMKDWEEWGKYEQDHKDRTVDKKIKQARHGTS